METTLLFLNALKNSFNAPGKVAWLIIIPLFFIVFWLHYFAFQKKLKLFFHEKKINSILSKQSFIKVMTKHVFILLAIFFLVVAFMEPKWGTKENQGTQSSDVILLIDVSNSMLVEDVKPNRLSRAKLSILSFLSTLKNHRVGIVVFSGSGYLLCPLTKDYGVVKKFINSINSKMVSLQGTDLALGLHIAIDSFSKQNLGVREKTILVFTDGENHNENVFRQGEIAKKKNIKIFSIGIGTSNGEFIPIKSENGDTVNYLKDKTGNPIVSRLDEKTLVELSRLTGGDYYFTEKGFLGINAIYNKISFTGEKSKSQKEDLFFKRDQYQLFLLLAYFFFFIELLLTTRKSLKKSK